MPNWGYFVAKLLSAIGSWLDASNLRNRVYQLQNENELMRIALEDIQRDAHELVFVLQLVYAVTQVARIEPRADGA